MRRTLRIAWAIMVTAFGKRSWTTGETRMMRAPLRCQNVVIPIAPAAHLVVVKIPTEVLVAVEAGRVQGRDSKAVEAGDAAKAKCPSRSRWSNRRPTW